MFDFSGGVLFFIVAIIVSVCTVKICNRRKRRKQEQGKQNKTNKQTQEKRRNWKKRGGNGGVFMKKTMSLLFSSKYVKEYPKQVWNEDLHILGGKLFLKSFPTCRKTNVISLTGDALNPMQIKNMPNTKKGHSKICKIQKWDTACAKLWVFWFNPLPAIFCSSCIVHTYVYIIYL